MIYINLERGWKERRGDEITIMTIWNIVTKIKNSTRKKYFAFFSENKTSFEKRYYIIIPESSGKQREKKTDFVII